MEKGTPVKTSCDEEPGIPDANDQPIRSKVAEPEWVTKEESKPAALNLELLQSIEWKRFEELCEVVFSYLNLHARNSQLAADAGIDLELYDKKAPEHLVAIAQCKACLKPVGVKHIRAFYGVMAATKVSRAYFLTTSSFTEDAIKFSRKSEVTLIDGATFLKLIESRSQDQADALLRLATEGDYTTPSCPGCGLKMVVKTASKTGAEFWGCRIYPRCKGKLKIKKGSST